MLYPLAAVLLASVAFAAPAPASSPADVAASFSKAQAQFLSHEAGQPTIDSQIAVAGGGARAQELKIALESAREIELGCVLPCSAPEDAQVYRGKVEMVSSLLGASPDQTRAAVERYLPGGKPRLRAPGTPASASPGDRLIEGKVLERLLSDGRLAGQTRERLNQRALAFADALGRTQVIGADPSAVAGGSGAPGRGLTPARIAALNSLPEAQSRILRDLATKPPPPPSAAPAPRPARSSPAQQDGLIANSKAYWDRIGEDPATGPAMRATAATLVSLFKVFNLDGFENSAFHLSDDASDPSVSRVQVLKDGAAVAGNAALAVVGVLPAGAGSKLAVTKAGAVGDWVAGARDVLRTNPAIAERVAALQSKAMTTPLTREEASWLGEMSKGDGGVIMHTTDSGNFAGIAGRTDSGAVTSGRVAATTERFVYGARKEVNSIWRQILSGVRPKDGTIIFQGQAATLFSKHEVTGAYSLIKRAAGQMTTNGAGDIVITKAVYNAETKTLSILEARMVTEGEQRFLLRSEGWSTAKLWGRRVVLDPAITSATGFIAAAPAISAGGGNIFEYILGPNALPQEPQARR